MKKRFACQGKNYSIASRVVISTGLLSLAIFMSAFFLPGNANPGKTTDASPAISGDVAPLPVNISITGVVKDENGQPLPGASVLVKRSRIAAVTDSRGAFRLNVPSASSVLVISFTGYETIEVTVGSQIDFDIKLSLKTMTAGDSVVVIGYGTSRKSDLTGSVGAIKESQLKERPSASLAQGLAGRIAGVQVNSNSGRPGGRTNVRIRGFSSINTSNNPLYIVDGVAMPVGNQNQATQAIDYINPNDIVSVEVLKDASSTAIYGARGANGVILVTTKRGKAGAEGRVTYDANVSTNTIGPKRIHVLNAKQFLETEDLAYKNMEKYDPVGWASGKYLGRDPALARTDPRVFDTKRNPLFETDWLKESVQHKLSQNHELGFTGGGTTSSYSVGLGYRDDEGLLLNSYLKRYSARITFDDQIKTWLKVGGTLSYNSQEENIVDQDYQVMRNIAEGLPFQPVKYADGTFSKSNDYPNVEAYWSPVHLLTDRKYILKSQTTIGSLYSNINLAKGLEMRTVLGVNVLSQGLNQYTSRTLSPGTNGSASSSNSKEGFWSLENYFTYTKRIAKLHSIKALLGLSWQESNYFASAASITNFSSDYFTFNNLGAGSTNPGYSSGASSFSFNSYFGRVNYTFNDKYLLTLTGRVDGSSRFGEKNKYAFFPSAALAWKVSDEDFLKDNTVISNLKIRTSYGLTGNSEIPSYSSLSVLSSNYAAIFNDTRIGGTGISRLANPDLRWEKTAQSDIGIELGLLHNRINIEADYYYRKTTDMLLDAPVARTSGYATIRKNVGSMENKGIELTLNTVNISTKDFTWNTSFNISMNRNKILSLATPADIFGVGGPGFTNQTNIIRVGEQAGSFWGLVRLGTWQESERAEAAAFTSYRNGLTMLPGDIKYLDVNGDKAITDADRMIIGHGSPNGWGGFLNTFKYKRLDLILELAYSYGNDVLDQTHHSSEDRQALANSYTTVLGAWTPTHQNTPIAEVRDTRAGYVTNVDTRWIQDGSFIRGKNLLLGYNFPVSAISRYKLNRLRLYVSIQNFFLSTKYTSGDPEVTLNTFGSEANRVFAQGQNFHDYPRPTTYNFGIQAGL
jgi:TonB-linked SusC/RagA family outer membrane protein